MSSAIAKRLEKLEQAIAARTEGPKTVRRAKVEAGAELPEEAADELVICRVIVTPPERPAEEALPEQPDYSASPAIERGDRTPIEIERRFSRPINYPPLGLA
jgi:hypothetical protein